MSDALTDIYRGTYYDGEPDEMTNEEYLKTVAKFTTWRLKETGAP